MHNALRTREYLRITEPTVLPRHCHRTLIVLHHDEHISVCDHTVPDSHPPHGAFMNHLSGIVTSNGSDMGQRQHEMIGAKAWSPSSLCYTHGLDRMLNLYTRLSDSDTMPTRLPFFFF